MDLENLDIENFDALRSYLRQHGYLSLGDEVCFAKLGGGVSNRAVLVTWPDGRGWVLKQALPKLRVEADWFSDPERIGVEAKALRWLNCNLPPGSTPALVFQDPEHHLLAMEAVAQPHQNWKSMLLAGHLKRDHFEQAARLLAAIHLKSSQNAGEVCKEFSDTRHFESLRLQPYYLYTAEQVPEAADFLNELAAETLKQKICLVHGDFSPKNVLVHNGRLVLLDHEVMHFGEPAFDLGFVLTHFLSKAHHLPQHRTHFVGDAWLFWSTYGRDIAPLGWPRDVLEPRVVRHTLACLLARVAGKSPLEYLDPEERARQRQVVLQLINHPPVLFAGLLRQFITLIGNHA